MTDTIDEHAALKTAAARKRNGYLIARIGLATNGIRSHYGVHVVCSACLPFTR